jgi:hypothetical protein
MKMNEQLLAMVQRVGRLVGGKQGWDVFDIGDNQWVVQADDEHDAGLDDHEAIRLAIEAGVDCDDWGRIRGFHDCAESASTRTWDVSLQTMVAVEMPADVDPDTAEGVEAIKQAAKAKFIAAIGQDSFDIGVEEYCGE